MNHSLKETNPDDLRTIAVVIGAHGLQGTLKLESLSDFPERFDSLKSVFLKSPGSDALRDYRIKRVRWAGAALLMTLHELTTRDDALAVRGWEVCVAEADSWVLPEDVYYRTDLLGFAGIGDDGKRLGILINILTGAQDILEFERENENLLVPFVSQWVGKVNPTERTIEILKWRELMNAESIDTEPSSDDD